jgi:hypothetical protein
MTKNTSTPTNPPRSAEGHRSATTTSATATPRSAWISDLTGRLHQRRSGPSGSPATPRAPAARLDAPTDPSGGSEREQREREQDGGAHHVVAKTTVLSR